MNEDRIAEQLKQHAEDLDQIEAIAKNGYAARTVLNLTLELALMLATASALALPTSGNIGLFAGGAFVALAVGLSSVFWYCKTYTDPLRINGLAAKLFAHRAHNYLGEVAGSLAVCTIVGYAVGLHPSRPLAIVCFATAFCAMWFAWPIPRLAAKECIDGLKKAAAKAKA